jgi:protein N-terminal amidase
MFCAELAQRLKCYVVAGYPERLNQSEAEQYLADTGARVVGANSAALYGPEGEWVGGYRKTNLYSTDQTWAKPGRLLQVYSTCVPTPMDRDWICDVFAASAASYIDARDM